METSFPCQLQQEIERTLAQGRFAKGDLLTLPELASQFQATPQEVERVLLAGHRKGIVRQKGAFFEVLSWKEEGPESLFQHATRTGMSPSTRVRAAVIGPASSTVAARLQVPEGAPVYRLERTRMVSADVIANQVNYIPFEVCPGLEHDDMSHYSFQRLLELKYHAVAERIDDDIRMAPASEQDRAILGLPSGAEVLVIERLSLSGTGCPLVWADIHLNPRHFHYVAELWPAAAAVIERRQGVGG